jgi:hypothetical protein
MSRGQAVALVKRADLATDLLATDTRHLAQKAMAVYYDKKGKPFAWQVRFTADKWEDVQAKLRYLP